MWRETVRDLPRFTQYTTFGSRHLIQGPFLSHSLFALRLSNNWKATVTDHVRGALKHFTILTLQCQNDESPNLNFVLPYLNEHLRIS